MSSTQVRYGAFQFGVKLLRAPLLGATGMLRNALALTLKGAAQSGLTRLRRVHEVPIFWGSAPVAQDEGGERKYAAYFTLR